MAKAGSVPAFAVPSWGPVLIPFDTAPGGFHHRAMTEGYVHLLAALTVCSRVADVWTTYLVSPTLKLEANPIARRFGWKFALLTILIGFVPYVSPTAGVIVLTASFLVAASNASKIVMAKALGEDELAALSRRMILATPPWPGLLYMVMPGICMAAFGGSMLLFYPQPTEWAYYFGVGVLAYAFAIFIWYPIRYFRVRADVKNAPVTQQPPLPPP